MSFISKNLIKLINEKRLRIGELSRMTGIPSSTLSEWTAGRVPRLSRELLKLTQTLGITLEELIDPSLKREPSGISVSTTLTESNGVVATYLVRIEEVRQPGELSQALAPKSPQSD